MTERLEPHLKTVLGDYPHTRPLKDGKVTSEHVGLDFVPVSPVHKAFAPMVRDEAYELSELAMVTALQAIAFGRPIVLLPAVVASRFQRACLVAPGSRPVAPEDLPGKRIGVRSYTQTTGMWVRAHLVEDYGLATRDLHWITRDGAHVAEYTDPDFVDHGIGDVALTDLLREGRLDAAIFGNDLPEGEEFVPVVKDAQDRDRAWRVKHGFMPINHMVAASRSAVEQKPEAIREAYGLLLRADEQAQREGQRTPPPVFGFDRLREPVAFTIDMRLEQGLLPRRLTVDEVFGPAEALIGNSCDLSS